jgi:hypothetical protein
MASKRRNSVGQETSSRVSASVLFTSPVFTPRPPKSLAPNKALAEYKSKIYFSQGIGTLIPRPITDASLSGSNMSTDGAWLEVGGDGVRVYGDTGEIHWFKDPVPSAAAWMNIYLPGMQPGGTYVGQIRCFTNPILPQQYHVALKVVYPDRFELSYIVVPSRSFVVPFAFISLSSQQKILPNVQFFPEYLSHCVVFDVHIKKM